MRCSSSVSSIRTGVSHRFNRRRPAAPPRRRRCSTGVRAESGGDNIIIAESQVRQAVKLSQLSYYTPDELRKHAMPLGACDLPMYYDGCRSFFNRSCQAYIWRLNEDKEVCVTFRGTAALEDVYEALNCKTSRVNLSSHMDLESIYIHTGFVEQFMSVQGALQEDLFRMLTSRPSIRRVCFVGHSMGGAVAEVAALYFGSILGVGGGAGAGAGASSDGGSGVSIQCVTLGSPKIGEGHDLEEAYKRCVPVNVRLINQRDIIPSVPSWLRHPVVGHVMHEGKIHVKPVDSSRLGDVCQWLRWYGDRSIKDHGLEAYSTSIDEVFAQEDQMPA